MKPNRRPWLCGKGFSGPRILFLGSLCAAISLHAALQAPAQTPETPPAQSDAKAAHSGMANAGPARCRVRHAASAHHCRRLCKDRPDRLPGRSRCGRAHGWHHQAGTPEKRLILEAKGPGVCLIDYDNDGWLDIYLVNGSTYDALAGKAAPPHAALFHNNHDGTFTDVTAKAGVPNDRWGYGCAVGDYDNDGWPDLYVTNFGKNRLYHNNHDGTFTDVARKSRSHRRHMVDRRHLRRLRRRRTARSFRRRLCSDGLSTIRRSPDRRPSAMRCCQFRGVQVMCGPRGLQGRARPSVPQQRRRHVYRRQPESSAWTTPTATTASARCLPT